MGYNSTAPFRDQYFINIFKINVMDLNTKQRKVLFKDIVTLDGIAVDPSKGLIFWTDYGGRIERASMDGNDRMV